MTNTLKVSDPSELLSLIPYQLGFTPSDSVVLVSLRGPRKQVGLVARIDVGDLLGAHKEQCAADLINHMIADDASALVLIGYSRADGTFGPESALYWLHDAMGYLAAMATDRLPVVECWVVTDEQFGHFTVDGACVRDGEDIYATGFSEVLHRITLSQPEIYADHFEVSLEEAHRAIEGITELRTNVGVSEGWPLIEVCQEHALPIERLDETSVAAHMVFEGYQAGDSRDCLARIAPESIDSLVEVHDAYEACLAERSAGNGSDWLDEALEVWLNAIDAVRPVPLNLAQVGMVVCALEHIPFRDAVLISCSSLGARGAREFLAQYSDGNPEHQSVDSLARRAVGEITDPQMAQRPNMEHHEVIGQVLTQLIALTVTEKHMPARALLALLAWWQGNLTLAQRHLEEAQHQHGTYGLADLIASALEHGLAPGWIRKINDA